MKTTVVIQDGRMQLVLTPETEAEKRMIAPFSDGIETRGQRLDTRVDRGNFSDCAGGWIRDHRDVQSLMIGVSVVQEKEREGIPMPPEPQVTADLLVKLAQFLSDRDDGQLEPPFNEHEISILGKWLRWQCDYTDARFR